MNEFNLRDASNAAIAQLQSEMCPNGFVALHNAGHITRLEVLNNICNHCLDDNTLATVVNRMMTHPQDWVREAGSDIRDAIQRRNNRITDFKTIADTSPLQPGCRMRLQGSYDQSEWWLNGNEYYDATFIRFAQRKNDEMPIAIIKFDTEIRMTEASGRNHNGKMGLLKLHFVSDWDSSETVRVHIIESLPNDIDEFYDSHQFGTEIESHANYTVHPGNGT